MSTAVVVLLVLAAGTYVFKAAGPLLLGSRRQLPAWVERFGQLLPVPLLAALVVTSSAANGRDLVVDARLVGLAVAAVALRFRAPFFVAVVAAAAGTAVARVVTG